MEGESENPLTFYNKENFPFQFKAGSKLWALLAKAEPGNSVNSVTITKYRKHYTVNNVSPLQQHLFYLQQYTQCVILLSSLCSQLTHVEWLFTLQVYEALVRLINFHSLWNDDRTKSIICFYLHPQLEVVMDLKCCATKQLKTIIRHSHLEAQDGSGLQLYKSVLTATNKVFLLSALEEIYTNDQRCSETRFRPFWALMRDSMVKPTPILLQRSEKGSWYKAPRRTRWAEYFHELPSQVHWLLLEELINTDGVGPSRSFVTLPSSVGVAGPSRPAAVAGPSRPAGVAGSSRPIVALSLNRWATIPQAPCDFDKRGTFRMKPALKEILQPLFYLVTEAHGVPAVSRTQEVFTYSQVIRLWQKYYTTKKHLLVDNRSSDILMLPGDLAAAFQTKACFKCELEGFLQSLLTRNDR